MGGCAGGGGLPPGGEIGPGPPGPEGPGGTLPPTVPTPRGPRATEVPGVLGREGGAIEGRMGRSGPWEGVGPPAWGDLPGERSRNTGNERMAMVPNVVAMKSAIATCLALCPFWCG